MPNAPCVNIIKWKVSVLKFNHPHHVTCTPTCSQSPVPHQAQWPLFSIPTQTIPWCMFAANLVIPAQICDELSRGQGKQVRYLMRGINGEKLGLKYLNVGKILMISSLCRVKCRLCLRSKTHGKRDYKKCHWRNPFGYVVSKMMTIFVTRLWCVKVNSFVGNWSKLRQTKTSTTKTSTNRNVDTPKRR